MERRRSIILSNAIIGGYKMKLLWSSLISTAIVLIVIFVLNRVPFTRDLVQAAIK